MPLCYVFEQLILRRNLSMALKVVYHLRKQILTHSVKVDTLRNWRPPQMKMRYWLLES